MSKRSFGVATMTPTATADTVGLTNATYMALASTSAGGLLVSEIFIGGQASASSINLMQFARDSTVGASVAALVAPNSDGFLNPALASALSSSMVSFTNATTAPQRSAAIAQARLHLNLNAFGGIVRWVAYPGEEWWITGVAVNTSESTLSAYTGGSVGAIGAHIVYEPM
jgi:hypothetical protein